MTQENHDNAERFLKQKYGNPQTENEFGWNEVISILAEYTERIKPSIIKLQSKLSEKDKEINALKEQVTPIPVSERLPEHEQKCLFNGSENEVRLGTFRKYDKNRGVFESGGIIYQTDDNTYWLPIPELTK